MPYLGMPICTKRQPGLKSKGRYVRKLGYEVRYGCRILQHFVHVVFLSFALGTVLLIRQRALLHIPSALAAPFFRSRISRERRGK